MIAAAARAFATLNRGVVYVRADVLLPVGPGGATEIIVPNMDTYCSVFGNENRFWVDDVPRAALGTKRAWCIS